MVDDDVFTALQLSEEVHQIIEVTAPLIVFFGLPAKEQIAVLPVLKESTYDFPDGDLTTSSALEVLVSAYNARLNSILICLMTMQDDSGNGDIKDFVDLIERLLEITNEMIEESFEVIYNLDSLETAEWKRTRELSSAVQGKLDIQLVVSIKTVEKCVEYWLHP